MIVLNDDNKLSQCAKPSILLIDADLEACTRISAYFATQGYAITVEHKAVTGLQLARARPWHAIILEATLPGTSDFDVLRSIRSQQDTPILIFANRGGETDQIRGLELGADDYLNKACSASHLLARLRAILRRSARAASRSPRDWPPEELTLSKLRITPQARRVTLNGEELPLTANEFSILFSLAKAKGRVKTRDHLSAEIYDREYVDFDRVLDVHVSSLRRKLGDDPRNPRYIRTIRSVGYMFIDPDVSESGVQCDANKS